MDLSKLSNNDKIIAGSGLLLFIASFLPWFGLDGFSATDNGWDTGFLWAGLPALLGLAAAITTVMRANGGQLPDLPIPWPLATLAAAGLSALLVVLKLAIGREVCGFGECLDLTREWGLWVAAIAALGLLAGSFLKFQEDKSTSPGSGPSL